MSYKGNCISVVSFTFLIFLIPIYVSAQDVTLTPVPLYMGQVTEGREAVRNLVLFNLSTTTLNVSSITFQGTNASDFSLDPDPGSFSVGLYQKVAIPVKFMPVERGSKSAQIVINSNASSSPDMAEVTGSGSRSTGGAIMFERLIGTIEGDGGGAFRPTSDGGFIIPGGTTNVDEDRGDAYLVKTNAWGEVQWTQVYDSDGNEDNSDGFGSVIEIADGYLVVGSTEPGNGRNDIWLVKTDLDGNFQWDVLFGGSEDDDANVFERTNDGNFIIGGQTIIEGEGKDAYLIKIDSLGTEIWSNNFGTTGGSEGISDLVETAQGDFYCVGEKQPGTQQIDAYVAKVNSAGVVQWEKSYGSSGEQDWEALSSIAPAHGGGFVVVGYTVTIGAGARDLYMFKVDDAGNKDAGFGDITFGGEHQDAATEVIATSDGGYLLVGSLENYYEEPPLNEWFRDVYLVKTDASGSEQWSSVFGGIRHDGAGMVREMADGSFVLSGSSGSYGNNENDIYFLRVNNQGEIVTALGEAPQQIPAKFYLAQNYPNPFNNSTIIAFSLPENSDVQITLYDLLGKKVRTLLNDFRNRGLHTVTINADDFASGIYFYNIRAGELTATRRMLLLK